MSKSESKSEPDAKQHRTNVTTTELTDSPQEQGAHAWAERRGRDNDEINLKPVEEPEA